MEKKISKKEEAKQYLTSNVQEILKNIVNTLLKTKPEDPLPTIYTVLEETSGKVTGLSHEEKQELKHL